MQRVQQGLLRPSRLQGPREDPQVRRPSWLLIPAGLRSRDPPLLSFLTSSPLKPYGCEECGKSYRLISLLNLHKKRHSGEARYRCEDCGKLFTTSGNLKRHQLVHSGEKPYQCDYCGRSFSDPTSKMRHLETHDTDKEHKCPHCDKKFNQVCGATAAGGQALLPLDRGSSRLGPTLEDPGLVGQVGG